MSPCLRIKEVVNGIGIIETPPFQITTSKNPHQPLTILQPPWETPSFNCCSAGGIPVGLPLRDVATMWSFLGFSGGEVVNRDIMEMQWPD